MTHNTSEFLNTLQTGDIILFSGNYWYSNIIKYFEKSKYSHVGMVLKDPTFIKGVDKGLYFIESGYEGMKDVEDHEKKFGVQINKLEDVIKQNLEEGSSVYYRKLVLDDESKRKNFMKIMEKTHKIVHGKPYDIKIKDWIKAEIALEENSYEHFKGAMYKKTSTFWCSALVTYLYSQLGLVDKDIPWTIVAPKEFSEKGTLLKLIDCKFGPETHVILKMVPIIVPVIEEV